MDDMCTTYAHKKGDIFIDMWKNRNIKLDLCQPRRKRKKKKRLYEKYQIQFYIRDLIPQSYFLSRLTNVEDFV